MRKAVTMLLILVMLSSVMGSALAVKINKEQIKSGIFDVQKGFHLENLSVGMTVVHYDGWTKVYVSGKEIFSIDENKVEYTLTPLGPKKASYIFEVPSGSYVVKQGNVIKVYDKNRTCILKIIDHRKRLKDIGTVVASSNLNGWIEDGYNWNINSLDYFEAYLNVPKSPPSPEYNTVNFLFNGIEPNTGDSIVQPVLEWNRHANNKWTISAWAVYRNGDAIYSTPLTVSEGDTIKGTMEWKDDYDPVIADCWYVEVKDSTTNKVTSLYSNAVWRDNDLAVFVTLEGYNIKDNSDICGDTIFYNMHLYDESYNLIYVNWDKWINPDASGYLSNLNVIVHSSSKVELDTAN